MIDIDRFANPELLLALVVVPFVLYASLRRRAPSIRFSAAADLRSVRSTWRRQLRWLPAVVRSTVLMLLIVAIARPQQTIGHERSNTEGVAIEIVLDRSTSMADPMSFDGIAMRRLEVVKRVLESFISGDDDELKGREGDLIGLIAFARYAETVCPLVHTHDTLVDLVKGTSLAQSRSEDGTAIGDAIALAAARLRNAEQEVQKRSDAEGIEQADAFTIKSKAIILLTDGSNNAGERTPREAAQLAAEWGIKIYAIGINDRPVDIFNTPIGELPFSGGRQVDEQMLRDIAAHSGGHYWIASDSGTLKSIYEEIDQLETTVVETVTITEVREQFLPFVLMSGFALLFELSLSAFVIGRVP